MAQARPGGAADRRLAAVAPPIVIGLVNSMPGMARRHTERQFRAILSAAAGSAKVELRFYSLDTAKPAAAHPRYDDITQLEAAVPDALIVTGMPPRAAALADEPCWGKLTELVDFAVDHAVPTVWSCLAAHAAVLYLDGIERRRLPEKLSGLFDCAPAGTAHPILAGLPRRWRIPHSRYNEVPEDALAARGYQILSRSADGGVDLFLKDMNAPFLFCQGHPEYDAETLPREYRRDIRRFLAGARDHYPAMPRGCFSPDVAARLAAFRVRALQTRHVEILAEFPAAASAVGAGHAWQGFAVALYANWLKLVAAHRFPRPAAGTAGRGLMPRHHASPEATVALRADVG
jgi:homoserine O-succinyltransferase